VPEETKERKKKKFGAFLRGECDEKRVPGAVGMKSALPAHSAHCFRSAQLSFSSFRLFFSFLFSFLFARRPCERCIRQDRECLEAIKKRRGRPPINPKAMETAETTVAVGDYKYNAQGEEVETFAKLPYLNW
jgi:hypothetical protein